MFQAYPVTTIGQCVQHDWGIVIACDDCRHEIVWGGEVLASMVPKVTTQDIAARLKCGHCGGDQGRVYHRPMAVTAAD